MHPNPGKNQVKRNSGYEKAHNNPGFYLKNSILLTYDKKMAVKLQK
jgi:hypothetical protein